MRRFILFFAACCLVCIFSGCSNSIVTTPPSPTASISINTPSLTAPIPTNSPFITKSPTATQPPLGTSAERFINTTTKEQLNTIVGRASLLAKNYTSFQSVNALTTKDLFNFYTGVKNDEMSECYNKGDSTYYVPVKNITAFLDQFLSGYHFDPKSYGTNFDEKTGIIKVRAYGSSWSMVSNVEDTKAISDNLVQIDSVFYYDREKPTENSTRMRLIIKITENGYQYISFVQK